MTTHHPILGRQILEIDPHWWPAAPLHRRQIARWRIAGESLDHHVGGGDLREIVFPAENCHAALPRRKAIDRAGIIDPQAHLPTVLDGQLPRQPPGNAGITEIVDDAAENIAEN